MSKFWVVALETYKRNVKSAAFIVMILSPFLLMGLVLGSNYIGSKFNETTSIAVISKDKNLQEFVSKQTDLSVETAITTEKEAQLALEEEKIDGYVVGEQVNGQVTGEFIGTSTLGTEKTVALQQVLTAYQLGLTSQRLNLGAEDIKAVTAQASLNEKHVEFKDGKMTEKSEDQLAKTLGAFFLSFAMYIIIIMYAQVMASEVASEKGTRIMEVILSSTTATKHFYGKIMGIFLVILTQIGIYLGAAAVAFFVMKDTAMVKELLAVVSLKELIVSVLGYNMLFLLLGVIIFTILSALCGSLVSKAEDVGKAIAPVTYLTLFGFMISMMFGMGNPQHIMMKVTSYIPFVSSFTMPSRIASGTVDTPMIWLSLAILGLSTVVLLKISAMLYQSTALAYSDAGMWKTLKRSYHSMVAERKIKMK